MKRCALLIKLLLIACFFGGANTALAEQAQVMMVNPLFASPIELRGKLGVRPIRMYLRPKTEDRDSVEGSYIVERQSSHKILLAGEVTLDKLSMEESVDGKDVSGQWDGNVQGNVVRGVWESADGSIQQEFSLELFVSGKPMQVVNKAKLKAEK